jgi:hypothetical protein
MLHAVKVLRFWLLGLPLGVAGCAGPGTPAVVSSGDALAEEGHSDRIRRAEDERARSREFNGDAGPLLRQEPMQTSP